jgi:excisionase family DNA binding protein
MRGRQRRGQPIPDWLRRHYGELDQQFRLSQSRHESDCGGGQSEPKNWITAKEVALMLGCSKRTVQRNAADLDGSMIGGRLLFDRRTVAAYVEGKRSA